MILLEKLAMKILNASLLAHNFPFIGLINANRTRKDHETLPLIEKSGELN